MAAQDTFDSFNASLTSADREQVKVLTQAKREELFAARSEDARIRLVHEYIKEVHDLLLDKK